MAPCAYCVWPNLCLQGKDAGALPLDMGSDKSDDDDEEEEEEEEEDDVVPPSARALAAPAVRVGAPVVLVCSLCPSAGCSLVACTHSRVLLSLLPLPLLLPLMYLRPHLCLCFLHLPAGRGGRRQRGRWRC